MKIILKHLHHIPSPSLTALIEQQLEAVGTKRQIDEARVTVERQLEASPPFRVSAHLVTPGPDVFAEASDHTLLAALQKTMAKLAAKIGELHQKRARRARNNRQATHPSPSALPSART